MSGVVTTGPVSERARRKLDELHATELNFELDQRSDFTPENGWHIDDYCQPLPPESPGPPLPDGSYAACKQLLTTYEFADPSIVRAVFHPDKPLQERDLVLEARFYGLRFLLGLRVGGVIHGRLECDGRPVQHWGWNYRTLQGHLEMGQMDYEVWKWLDSGEVQFRIHAFSRAAHIPNPVIRFGFRLFGRRMQRKFARNAMVRMNRLVRDRLVGQATGVPVDDTEHTLDSIDVRPAASQKRTRDRI